MNNMIGKLCYVTRMYTFVYDCSQGYFKNVCLGRGELVLPLKIMTSFDIKEKYREACYYFHSDNNYVLMMAGSENKYYITSPEILVDDFEVVK